jgi:hypothetical protein
MKLQIRQGVFETNSSSTHAISVAKYLPEDWNQSYKVPEKVHFGLDREFGWEYATYEDTESKAAYLWLIICDMHSDAKDLDKLKEVRAYIEKVLYNAGVKEVSFDMGSYKECTWSGDGSLYLDHSGYIDHSDEAYDFAKALLENDEMLLAYLFDCDSCVATGNDNSDEEVFESEYAKWIYRKGN